MEEIKRTDKPKKIHPYLKANIFSKMFFCWLFPYFVKGWKRELGEDDMYGALKPHEAIWLGDKLEAAWNSQAAAKKVPSLRIALFKVFGWELGFYALFYIFREVIMIAQPILISLLLKFYEPHQTEITQDDAYLYSGLIVLTSLINVMGIHLYMFQMFHLGMKIRVATCSLVYRKALKLSKSALAETTIGQMVNLLSNDVGRFDFATTHIHNLWAAPILTIIVSYLLYSYVGLSGLTGAAFLMLFVPFQMYMGKLTSRYRLRTALRTDERVRLMSEIISGIQVIKMYTWEKPFAKLVELSRHKEMKQIRSTSLIRAFMMSCILVLNRASIYLCIITFVLTGNVLNASFAYTVASFYGILRQVVTHFFPMAITQVAETNVSIKRIQAFLMFEEIHAQDKEASKDNEMLKSLKLSNGTNHHKQSEVGIHLNNASVKWLHSLPDDTLETINFDVSSSELVAVVGPVGSGKTTLFHAILKELPLTSGSINVEGTVSYASQEPWLFGGSIRQNILFGEKYDAKRYNEVTRVCALERDFTLFPYGDQTLAGERGVTLSGGQRARINLARAVYKEADIYLLDDPLSAVDTHVGKQLFDDCVNGYLKNKCVVLITHQLQYLRNVKTIYFIEDGRIITSGTYSQLKASDTAFKQILATSEEEEEKENKRESQKIEDKKDEKVNEDAPQLGREERGTGVIAAAVYKSYIKAGGGYLKTCLMACIFLISNIFASCTDYFVNIWSNVEQWRSEHGIISKALNRTLTNGTDELFALNSFGNGTDDIFTTVNPTESSMKESLQAFLNPYLTERNSIIIYSVLVLTTMTLTVGRSIYFFRYCMIASTRLHNTMFSKIVYATMRFFNTNPSGRILNRFSKDMGAVDETLPLTIIDTIQIGLTVFFITVVIGSLNPWILVPTVIIATLFYGIRTVFLATSRDIKRVEAVTRSPIYTHLYASLQGLTTIRAFGAQEILAKEFDHYQDKYSAAYFMFMGANRTFGFWLDFFCVVYITLVILSFLFIESEIFGGNVGLALTQSMNLMGLFQWGMRQWSELENQMTSVERIQEYTEINPESDEKAKEPPKGWPEKGGIKFDQVCLRYAPEEPYVLKNLNFEIRPREKVGIVGRTGAGKSSLISALFRLTEIDGKILIDNVNSKEILLNVQRSKISIIPQEPVLFSGTLRKNLDPFDEFQDEVLWSALDEVELKNVLADLQSGLDSKMAEGGSNFSVGQRQLLCLARAIIRNNKILVLDEATANVDPHTDGLIQSTIRRKFADCTVLTIAHRLHTIMDSDKVLVMDAGRCAEFDHPHILLQNTKGVFYGLVQQTGKSMAENLASIAAESYKNLGL